MKDAVRSPKVLDYAPCQYGRSKLVFRGPKSELSSGYVAVLGGSETYGRFVPTPFCALMEDRLGMPVVNFGCQNAGIDAFLYDPDVLSIAKGARMTVLQLTGAANMSNRFYRVHPRRNDRFLGPSDMLRSIYPEVDFTEYSFVRHMLSSLNLVSTERFDQVRRELQTAWSARMKLLLQTIDGPVLCLWLRYEDGQGLGADPLFVTSEMVDVLAVEGPKVLELSVRRAHGALDNMVFGQMEAPVASEMLNVATHRQIAERLGAEIRDDLA